MPVREIKTTIALDGEQQFKKALADASREMRVMDSELKAVSAAYRANGDGAEYFASKQRNLKSQISQQEAIIKGLEQAVEDAGKAYGESSSQVDGYTIKLNNARAKLSQLEKQLSETDREVEELGRDSVKAGRQIEDGIGESAQEAEKDVRGLIETLQDDLSSIRANTTFTAIGSLWDMAKGAYTSVSGFVESTAEYRRQLSFLEQNAMTHDFDFEAVKAQLIEVQALTRDSSAAVEGLSNLLAIKGMDESNMQHAVDLLAGAVISFPDTVKFESLADSIQETLATGQATGQYAELLGRLGVDTEEFNKALEKSKTDAGDLDIVLGYLATGGMKDVYNQWQQNNQAMYEAGETQAELESEMARFGRTLEGYIVTPTKNALLEALRYVNDTVELAEEEGVEVAAKKVGEDTKNVMASMWQARKDMVEDVYGIDLSGPGWNEDIFSTVKDYASGTKREIMPAMLTEMMLGKMYGVWGSAVETAQQGLPTFEKAITQGSGRQNPKEVTKMPVLKEVPGYMDEKLKSIDMDAYYSWIDQERQKQQGGNAANILDILFPPAYAEEAEEQGEEAGAAFLNGMEKTIKIDQSEAKLAQSLPTIYPVETQQEIEEAMKGIEKTVSSYEDDLEEAGEEAGDAMSSGFESAWAALENKAYMAGVSTGAAYAEGMNSQMGAISAAANRLSAVAAAGISRASSIARMGITLNLDGRKVAEGLAPYTDEVMATAINFD